MTEVFPIVPTQGRLLWVLLGLVAVVMVAVVAVVALSARGARHSSFEISGEGLRLHGDLYGRLIPAAAIKSAEARLVNVGVDPGFGPTTRIAGTAVPGYHAGWYKLRNGEKALLYLTERKRAVYVPTTLGYSVLLSPQEPERFVDRLRAITASK
jgi:hypothetical protein